MTIRTFAGLEVSGRLLRALGNAGHGTLPPIQVKAIPLLRDPKRTGLHGHVACSRRTAGSSVDAGLFSRCWQADKMNGSTKERFMQITLRLLATVSFFLVFPALGMIVTGGIKAGAAPAGSTVQCDPGFREIGGVCTAFNVPANAYSTTESFGKGWECNRGFKQANDACLPIAVPANAYLDSSGDGWKCHRGYQVSGDTCAAILVPANGFLVANSYGGRWKCNRGYRAANGACELIVVPENAFATNVAYGSGWQCERGHIKTGNECVPIKVPTNAYLNSYGDEWKCDRGYRKADEGCVAVKVPENAFLADSYRVGWECKRGYRNVDETCVAVSVPENAHLDYSGNDWTCNRPYWRRGQECVLN